MKFLREVTRSMLIQHPPFCCVRAPIFGVGSWQVDTGDYFPVEMEEKGYFCEYWISPMFQTCLKLRKSKHKTNVFLVDGRYYERGEKSLGYDCGKRLKVFGVQSAQSCDEGVWVWLLQRMWYSSSRQSSVSTRGRTYGRWFSAAEP